MNGPMTDEQIKAFKALRRDDLRYLFENSLAFLEFGQNKEAVETLRRVPQILRMAQTGSVMP
jgi:hypothetical protein